MERVWNDSSEINLKSAFRNLKSAILLGALVFALSVPANAQQSGKVPRIGLLISTSTKIAPFTDAFRDGMRELGYSEGKNYFLEIRARGSKTNQLSNLVAEMIRLKVDVIVTLGHPALLAAKEATSTIPIVMRMGGDPVKLGDVASLAHPGGNITGVGGISVDMSGKRLELLAETIPEIRRIAVLTVVRDHTARVWYREINNAARKLGVKLQIVKGRDPDTIDSAFSAMSKEHAEALVVIPTARYGQYGEHILRLAEKNRLPSIYADSTNVERGGLMSYGVDYPHEFRRTSVYVDKILKGAKPANLPVERPTKFNLVINLKTAKALGLKMPAHLLMAADKVIE
jgi:putative ABC transport system substrate-binding protein